MIVNISLLSQTNQEDSKIDTSVSKTVEIATEPETPNESDHRLSNSSRDLGPLSLMETHAPAVYEILEDPEWQDLDEIGRYRVLVPELRTTWGLERSSSKKLVETLNSIDRQIANGKQKRLGRNAKRILGLAQDTLFDQFSQGLEWIVYLGERWKRTKLENAIATETLKDHLDCIKSCESKLFSCYVQAESDFEQEVIKEIEKALSDPVDNRDLVRKWRGRSPHSASTNLLLSMSDCYQDLLQRDGWECDRIILFDITSPSAKVELPEKSESEPKPDSSHENSADGSSPGTS